MLGFVASLRRHAAVVIALIAASLVIPTLLMVSQAHRLGLVWQARDGYPLYAGILLVAGAACGRGPITPEGSIEWAGSRLAFRRLSLLIAVAVAVSQFADFVWALRRYTVGLGATVNPFAHVVSSWVPPVPVIALLVTGTLVTIFYGWWIVGLARAGTAVAQLSSPATEEDLDPWDESKWRLSRPLPGRTRRRPGDGDQDPMAPSVTDFVFAMKVHLVDGTYELFRHFFGAPPHRNADGQEVAAVRGVVSSVLQLLGEGATHVGVATDHVIESFRNDLWPGYKTGEGVDPDLWSQAWPLEAALAALGVVVWPMVELEADDALASGAAVADADPEVDQVVICTPDKDLGQCVRGTRIVQLDRRKDVLIDEDGVTAKFGVGPASIPDYLALVGDSADGFPGLAGWGAKSAATVLARWNHVEDIPPDSGDWGVTVRGAAKLATTLQEGRDDALLFKDLATLRIDPLAPRASGRLALAGTDGRVRRGVRRPGRAGHRPAGRSACRRPLTYPEVATDGTVPENVRRRR